MMPETPRRWRALGALALLALTAVGSCGDSTAPKTSAQPSAPALTQLELPEDSLALPIGDSLVVPLRGLRADGTLALASDASWLTRDARVATTEPGGSVLAIGAGRVWVVAASASLRDSTLIIVRSRVAVHLASHADTLTSLGDTLALLATDAAGAALNGLTWVARDTAIVWADQAGHVVARRPGNTYILAIADGGGVDSAQTAVMQRPASVRVTPAVDSEWLARPRHFTAAALDGRQQVIAGASATWSASDSALVSIDASGTVTGRVAGTDTIRAAVLGLTGQAILRLLPLPPLRINKDTIFTGVGQYPSSFDREFAYVVADSIDPQEAVDLDLVMSDTSVAAAPTGVSIPQPGSGPDSVSVLPIGRHSGTATLTASSRLYAASQTVVRVSDAVLRAPTADTLAAGYAASIQLRLGDALGHWNQNSSSVVVHARSSDTSIVVATDSLITIGAGGGEGRFRMSPAAAGTAWIVFSAAGYIADSTRVVVTALPPLRFYAGVVRPGSLELGLGQMLEYHLLRIELPDVPAHDVVVTLTHSNPTVTITPATVDPTRPLLGTTAFVDLTAAHTGVDTIVASAGGYLSDSLVVHVTRAGYDARPPQRVDLSLPAGVPFLSTDSARSVAHPVAVNTRAVVSSSDPAVLRVTTDTITFTPSATSATANLDIVGLGSATLTIRPVDGDALPFTTAPIQVVPAPSSLVFPGASAASHPTITLGMHQELPADSLIILSPGYVGRTFQLRSTDTTVVMPTVDQLTPTSADATRMFNVVGGSRAGTAWIVASAPGVTPDSIQFSVARGEARVFHRTPISRSLPNAADSLGIQLVDQAGRQRVAAEDVRFQLWPSNASVVYTDSASITVRAGQGTSATTPLRFQWSGSGVIRAVDSRGVSYAYPAAASELFTSGGKPLTDLRRTRADTSNQPTHVQKP